MKLIPVESSSSIFKALEMYSNAFLWWCFWLASAGSPAPGLFFPLVFIARPISASRWGLYPLLWRDLLARILVLQTKIPKTNQSWIAIVRKSENTNKTGPATILKFRLWNDGLFEDCCLDLLSVFLRPHGLPGPLRFMIFVSRHFYKLTFHLSYLRLSSDSNDSWTRTFVGPGTNFVVSHADTCANFHR